MGRREVRAKPEGISGSFCFHLECGKEVLDHCISPAGSILNTQALALTRSKSPKKDTSSMPVSPSHHPSADRETDMVSPKVTTGCSTSSNSSTTDPSADRAPQPNIQSQPIDVNGGSGSTVNHHLPTTTNGGGSSSSSSTTLPAISVSQSLLAAAAATSANRSGTPRISVSSSLTAPPAENNGPASGRESCNPSNGPHVDRPVILQSPVAAVAAAAAAMQDRKQEFDFSKVNARRQQF
uniref:Uncharacterized protein n=1 Tax=Anopheles farauti TaxID=69004 RepID=A0A182Q7P2_9DIPT